MGLLEAELDDFYCMPGGVQDLIKSDVYQKRLKEIEIYRNLTEEEKNLFIAERKKEKIDAKKQSKKPKKSTGGNNTKVEILPERDGLITSTEKENEIQQKIIKKGK